MFKNAELSRCRRYRYALWRVWDNALPTTLFIALNPSTADENVDDRTVARCVGYARSWGYGGIAIGNLFAYRETDPDKMRMAEDPIGPENDSWLRQLSADAGIVIASWGVNGAFLGRDSEVLSMIEGMHCLAVTKAGHPKHPLHLKKELQPIPYLANHR